MSNFIVSARKYRPQRFEDVVGQRHVAGTLKNALMSDHVAHAFLFTGPRGVGKTTCARILARILNCENRTAEYEACNTCSSCKAFNENASFNIIELDAASNNSVEHIRALIEQVRFQPQQGKYKVFIIDEVHMLSNQAFNAFLKTLEEPPPYAIFILATTEKHKIIPTILSRCQIFDFRRISPADMVLHLKAICAKEGVEAEEDALHIIAQKADGALRDALSIFDRINSAARQKITYNDVIENLNILDYDYYFSLTDTLLAEDRSGLMNLFDQILGKGFEPDLILGGLAEHLRNLLVCKDEATLALLEVGENLRERYRKQAILAPVSFLLSSLNILNDCDIHFKTARHKRLHAELGLLKLCHINRTVNALQEKKTLELRETPVSATPRAPSPAVPPFPQSERPSSTAHTLSREEMKELASNLKEGLRKAETLPLSLEAFEKAVAIEEAHKAGLQSRFSFENAVMEWKRFADRHESNMVRIALNAAALSVDGKTITAKVGAQMDKNHIQNEAMRLLDALRSALHDAEIMIRVEIDEQKLQEQAVQKPLRPLTAREKVERMCENNPAVGELLRRFDLKIDD